MLFSQLWIVSKQSRSERISNKNDMFVALTLLAMKSEKIVVMGLSDTNLGRVSGGRDD